MEEVYFMGLEGGLGGGEVSDEAERDGAAAGEAEVVLDPVVVLRWCSIIAHHDIIIAHIITWLRCVVR